VPPERAAPILWSDYRGGGRHEKPGFMAAYLGEEPDGTPTKLRGPKRQSRHASSSQRDLAKG
jgi:hypothetical protein